MAYVTVAQLKAALANAGGAGSRTAAELPDDRLRANLDEADSEVVGRLRLQYAVPPPGDDPNVSPETVPDLMRTIIVGIAGYLATLEFYGSQPVEDRDSVVLRYNRAQELLGRVASGRLVVDGLDPLDSSAPVGEATIYQGTPSLGVADSFNPNYLDGRHNVGPYAGGVVWE